MAEKFLILGASSFYGSNFALLVKQRYDDVLIPELRWRLGQPLAEVAEADYIVNFASQSLVAESWDAPEVWTDANVTDTTNLFNQCRHFKDIKKFIHVSTPEVYGSTPMWVKEDYPFNPTTPYAVSRAAGDMMLKAFHRAYTFPALITRTANIYGPGQPEHRIIPKALAYKRRDAVLPLHGGGQSIRSFIHVRDACEATYLLAKRGTPGETYHISTRKTCSIARLVEMIGARYEVVPDRLGKDEAYLLDSEKMRALGWEDRIALKDGLCELSL